MRYENITDAIGNTPLVRIDPAVHGLRHIDLYAKLEMLNPFGSLKDRAAWNMVRGRLPGAGERGETVVELSSGNTAKALALIAGMHGLPFKSVTNRMRVPEIKDLLLLLGAEIEELPGRSECLDPTDTEDPLTLFHQQLGRTGGAHLHTDQYFNALNTAAHATGTGPEIVADLDGRAPDWFIACVGTAGSSTGVASALRAHDPAVRVVGLVGEKSDFIPGIRTIDEVQEVGIFDPATYDAIEPVSADEALDGMLTLLRRCGLLAGPTGGAAYSGAVRHLRPLDRESGGPGRRTAVFIVCDRVESYLGYVRRLPPGAAGRARGAQLGGRAHRGGGRFGFRDRGRRRAQVAGGEPSAGGRPARPVRVRRAAHRGFGEHRGRALRRTPAGRHALRQAAAGPAGLPGRREVRPVRGPADADGASRRTQSRGRHRGLAGRRGASGA